MTKMGCKKTRTRRKKDTERLAEKLAFDRQLAVCDRLWGRLIRMASDGLCPICCKEAAYQAHHLLKRGHRRHHWAPWRRLNGLMVGQKCHANPAKIMAWLKENRSKQYQWVQQEKLKINTGLREDEFNLQLVEEYLREQI